VKDDGAVEVHISRRTKKRLDAKIRELTPRSWGQSVKSCMDALNVYLKGWAAYFRLCTEEGAILFRRFDAHRGADSGARLDAGGIVISRVARIHGRGARHYPVARFGVVPGNDGAGIPLYNAWGKTTVSAYAGTSARPAYLTVRDQTGRVRSLLGAASKPPRIDGVTRTGPESELTFYDDEGNVLARLPGGG